MFGVEISRNYKEALELDAKNGNHKWKEATELELLDEYNTFKDLGKPSYNGKKLIYGPKGYKHIRIHVVYACKHDLHSKPE